MAKELARYEVTKDLPPYDTTWTDIPEATPRCRVRCSGDCQRALVLVIQEEGGEPELHVMAGDVEIDHYADDKYQAIRDEVR